MREKFSAYYRPSEEEFVELWKRCLFVLDSNVLLNLYRFPQEARNDLLKTLETISSRLWIPHQVALEYQENRLLVMADQLGTFKLVKDTLAKVRSTLEDRLEALQLKRRHSTIDVDDFVKNVRDEFHRFLSELEELEKQQADPISEDALRCKIDELFKGKVGAPFSKDKIEEIYKNGQARMDHKIPPGYMDISKAMSKRAVVYCNGTVIRREYGDLILWNQIVDHCSRTNISHLILVTDDQKDDWWWKIDSKGPKIIGPRPELVQEVKTSGVSCFYQYNSENFLRYAKQHLQIEVGEESIRQVQETRELERIKLLISPYVKRTARGTLRLGESDYRWDGMHDSYSSSIGIFSEGGLSRESLMELRHLVVGVTISESLNNTVPGSNADISISFEGKGQDNGRYSASIGVIPAGSPGRKYGFELDSHNIEFIKRNFENLDRIMMSANGAIGPPESIDWHAEIICVSREYHDIDSIFLDVLSQT